jgi:hypothetical protein
MPLSIPPGFSHLAIEFRHDLDPEPWYATYAVDHGGIEGGAVDIGQLALDYFADAWDAAFSTEVRFTGVMVTMGQDGPDPVRTYVPSEIERRGTSQQAMLPQNCALLVRKNTALGGRRNRGRLFLPGCVNEGATSGTGVINGSTYSIYLSYANAWFVRHLNGQGADAGVMPMYLLHSTGITPVPEPTEITALSVDPVISTQRRRLR